MRVATKDILVAVKREFAACVPKAKHYFGNLEEDYRLPAFLYFVIYDGGNKNSFFTSEVTKEIQIVYFGERDGYKKESYQERLQTEAALREFLDKFYINVGDRYLKFTYEIKEADKQMAIYLTFRYLDESPNPDDEEEQKRETAENVNFTKKEERENGFT